ncbi:hypothetical protein WKK05_40425 (plasmid) [Nostoc sp. UHCC 0302]|uniref:hypothetical protein n=1 Tax=Nostoc sp. UHCC 0302 TaxID=3134896 RepID=UPI00311CCDBC
MNPMTAEGLQQQKLSELLIELPSTPEEMRTFLSPENLNRNHLPFPAADFNLPGIGEYCGEELAVSFSSEDERLFVRSYSGVVAAIKRENVLLREWFGLWLIALVPRK